MSSAPEEPQVERSLLAKFRYATFFQGMLIVALAVGALAPTLRSLFATAAQHREEAKAEVIDAGVNNMARLLAMELAADSLPELSMAMDRVEQLQHSRADAEDVRAAESKVDSLARKLSHRIEEKISYNGVLVDLVVAMPHLYPSDSGRLYLFPVENPSLPHVGLEEIKRLARYPQLSKLSSAKDAVDAEESELVKYLVQRASALGAHAYLMPVRREGVPYGYAGMVVKTDLISEEFERSWYQFRVGLERSLVWLAVLSALALVGGAIFINVLASRLIQPLKGIREAIEEVPADATRGVDSESLHAASIRLASIAADPLDEVGALRTAFLHLSDHLADTLEEKAEALERLKESTQQLQRSDRLRLLGMLSYGLAHNLNNALAPIANVAHAARMRHPEDEKLAQMTQLVLDALQRSRDIIGRLRDLTRVSSGEMVAVDVNRVMDEALESVRREMSTVGIRVHRELGSVSKIEGNPIELWEVFTNILVNAREAIVTKGGGEPGMIQVRTSQKDGVVRVEIDDNGTGMSEAARRHALEPWYSTKKGGQASGIGLWISSRIVAEHGGDLAFTTNEWGGTKVAIQLRGARKNVSGTEDAAKVAP